VKRLRVLVFPCGSEIGLEIYRSLWCMKEVELFGGSSVDDHGKFVYKNYIDKLPFIDSPDFLQSINQIIASKSIDYIIAAHDSVLLSLAEAREEGLLNCPVITSPYRTVKLCRSKKSTYKLFSGKLRVPHVYPDLEKVDRWPVFLKPDVGQGSKGTVLVNNSEVAKFFTAKDSSLLILENLPGEEFTVDCFTDRHGQLRFVGPRRRVRISNGISVNTKPVAKNRFDSIANRINEELQFRGMWFFQVKESVDETLGLMEIAPRLAGTMGLYRNLGVNFPLLSLFDAEGYDIRIIVNDFEIEMDRALGNKFKVDLFYKHAYIDFDDCLLQDGKVNLQIILFIFQCCNKGIKIHLLTRHAGNIQETLKLFRLFNLFDSIITISNGAPKSKFILHKHAVFIDDSFRERIEVRQSCGIPVFSPDAIESLLD